MTLREVADQALRLPSTERAELVEKLLSSLEDVAPEEWLSLWAEEAERRDSQMDAGLLGEPAGDVFRALLDRAE